MTDTPELLRAHHLKTLKLPTFLREYDKLARQCAAEGLDHVRFLARLVEPATVPDDRAPDQGGEVPGAASPLIGGQLYVLDGGGCAMTDTPELLRRSADRPPPQDAEAANLPPGPVPAVDGVVRWRRKDLARWLRQARCASALLRRHYAQNEGLDHVRFLARLVELELIDRERRMIERRIT